LGDKLNQRKKEEGRRKKEEEEDVQLDRLIRICYNLI
jgi:hypothetical protein